MQHEPYRYVEAMAAILVPLIVPSEGDAEDVEAARKWLVEFGLFKGLDTSAAARILAKESKANRGAITSAEIVSYAKSLPAHLREKVFATYVFYFAEAYDGTFSDQHLQDFKGLEVCLDISYQQALKIIEVSQIVHRCTDSTSEDRN